MKKTIIASTAVLLLALTLPVTMSSVARADQNTAAAVVDAVRLDDPPVESTNTKPSPVGQNASDYQPAPPPLVTHDVPSPVNPLNPQNDPDVQRGLDSYQKPTPNQ
jgi:hypothetical protein